MSISVAVSVSLYMSKNLPLTQNGNSQIVKGAGYYMICKRGDDGSGKRKEEKGILSITNYVGYITFHVYGVGLIRVKYPHKGQISNIFKYMEGG